jgi:hypothetical protein
MIRSITPHEYYYIPKCIGFAYMTGIITGYIQLAPYKGSLAISDKAGEWKIVMAKDTKIDFDKNGYRIQQGQATR